MSPSHQSHLHPGDHHDHDHDHHHDHEHEHAVGEHYSARKHPEFVVLDLGDDIGALIIHTDAEMHGVEVEISPAGHDDRRQHKEVLERRAGESAAFTAVFDGLQSGAYTLWVGGALRARGIIIEGGTIAELDWTARGREPAGAARG